MSRNLAVATAKVAARAPQVPESLRRLLADPFSLSSAVPEWTPPTVLPQASILRAAATELERGLRGASPGHMQWCLNKLFVLPTRDGSTVNAAFAADNFIDTCGHFPDDLWSVATLELLQSKTFRPAPAEFFAAVKGKFDERRRMLERVMLMLGGKAIARPGPFVPDSREVVLRTTLRWARKRGEMEKAARYERELAQLENREPEAWAIATDGAPA